MNNSHKKLPDDTINLNFLNQFTWICHIPKIKQKRGFLLDRLFFKKAI